MVGLDRLRAGVANLHQERSKECEPVTSGRVTNVLPCLRIPQNRILISLTQAQAKTSFEEYVNAIK